MYSQTRLGALRRALRRLLPWIVCALLFYYLFEKIPPGRLWEVWAHVDLGSFLAWSFLYFLVVLFGDCVALHYFFKRFVAPMRFAEICRVRGASFLMAVMNYMLGQAALAYYARKKYRASLSKALGTMTFITIMDLMLVITSGFVALILVPQTVLQVVIEPAMMMAVLLFFWGSYAAWAMFWHAVDVNKLQAWRRKPWLDRVLNHAVFLIFREAGFTDYVVLFLTRLPLLILVVANVNLALRPFASSLPWDQVFLFDPVILLVGSLPITPAGLGSSQVLLIEFFSHSLVFPAHLAQVFSPAEVLFAVGVVWCLANQFYKAIFAALCLSKSSK